MQIESDLCGMSRISVWGRSDIYVGRRSNLQYAAAN